MSAHLHLHLPIVNYTAKELGAMPVSAIYRHNGGCMAMEVAGITLREKFAMAAMQGCTTRGGPPGDVATYALACADALLAELAKEQP